MIDGYSIGQLSRNTNAANGKAATSNGGFLCIELCTAAPPAGLFCHHFFMWHQDVHSARRKFVLLSTKKNTPTRATYRFAWGVARYSPSGLPVVTSTVSPNAAGRTGTRPGPLSASVAATSNGYGQKVSRELPHPQARSQPQPPVANMAHMTLLEHEIPTSLTFSKIYGFCEFLNGRYIRQKNHKHNDKPTYRSEFRAPTEAGPAGGNYVFLFYHQRNSAWVLGLMISESSGAAAYRKGNEPVPNMPSNQYWAVSNKQGKFEALAGVTCVAGYDGSMVQAEVASAMPRSPLEPSTLVHPTGTSRTDAQKMLFSEASNHDGGHGAFVLRYVQHRNP